MQIKSIETIRKRSPQRSLHARTIITCDYTSNARRSSMRHYRKICKSALSIHAGGNTNALINCAYRPDNYRSMAIDILTSLYSGTICRSALPREFPPLIFSPRSIFSSLFRHVISFVFLHATSLIPALSKITAPSLPLLTLPAARRRVSRN